MQLLLYHWAMTKNAEWAADHPCHTSHGHLAHLFIPLRYHGDDASIKSMTGRKLFILSIHGEFGPLDAAFSRLLSIVLYDDRLVKGRTIPELMRVWRWSWDALFTGTHPVRDHAGNPWPVDSERFRLGGTPLAGGWRFIFSGSLGDWSFHSKLYYPEMHGSSHNFLCHRCNAARHLWRLRFWAVGREAAWTFTRISTRMFKAALDRASCSEVYWIPGWCLSLVRVDFMHCCFLGLFLITVANCVWELIEMDHFGPFPSIDAKLAAAYMSLTAYVRRHGLNISLRSFTPAVFGSPSDANGRGPELHSKAHDCRIMVGWMACECARASDVASAHGRQRHALAWSQQELSLSLEEAPRYLLDHHLRRMTVAAQEFLELYVALTEQFKETSRCLDHPMAYKVNYRGSTGVPRAPGGSRWL